jgi:hypothetical protein
MERLIEKGMAEGLDDERIIDRILTGGDQTLSRYDIDKMEQEKEDELLREAIKQGYNPISGSEGILFGNENQAKDFEAFQ